jgi:hypothetical protein
MAYEFSNYSVKVTLVAGADLSAKQYFFVKLNSSGQAILCAAATDVPVGVLQNAPTSGQEAEVLVVGGTKLVASAAITLPAQIGTASTGKAAALVAGTDTTKYVAGSLISAAAADADVVTAVINCANPHRAA